MTKRAVTRELAQYIVDLKYEDLSQATIQAAKEAALDQLGIMLMGSTLPCTQAAYEVVRDLGGRPECTIVGYGTKVSAPDAAFVNANFGHSCELDDTGYDGGCHPGALTVPPALALAAREHLSGRDLLLAVVLGYEILTRIGRVMTRPVLDRGFHHQSVVGPFGAAAVAGKLLGLNVEQMVHALSIAGSHSSGTMEYDQGGGEVKRLHSAIPVRSGMMAVLLAQRGLTGPHTILEGLRGIPRLFGGVEDVEPMVNNVGNSGWYAIQGRIVKPFPTSGTIHTSIQAMTRLMQEQLLLPGQVKEIDVGVNSLTLTHCGSIYEPEDTIGAQFSLPFSLGLRLVKGRNDLRDYLDHNLWKDPEIVAVAKKVRIHSDPKMVGDVWYGARIHVVLADGRAMEAEELYRKGSPQDPFTWEELNARFRSLASAVLDEQGMRRVIEMVSRLEEVEDISQMAHLLVRPLQVSEGRPVLG